MSFGAEMKDFVAGFKVGQSAVETFKDGQSKRKLQDAHAKYYDGAADRANSAEKRAAAEAADGDWVSKNAPGAKTGVSTSGGNSTPAPKDKVLTAVDYTKHLVGAGENPIVASGMVGNGWHESQFDHNIAGDGGNSHGIFQNNVNGRYPAFQKWAKDTKLNPEGRDLKDPKAQLDFARYDLQTNFKSTYAKMNAAKDPRQAADIFAREYERPKDGPTAHWDKRQNYAQQAYDAYTKTASGALTSRKPEALPGIGKLDAGNPKAPAVNDKMASADTSMGKGGFDGFDGEGFSSEFDTSGAIPEDRMQPQAFAAAGGPIEAIPEGPAPVTDDFAAKNGLTPQGRAELEGARGASMRQSVSRGEAPDANLQEGGRPAQSDPAVLGNGLHNGLMFLQKTFGLNHQTEGAVSEEDPRQKQAKQRAYASGAGGSSPEEKEAAEKAVDPDGTMPGHMRSESTLAAIAEYFKDDPEKQAKAIASMTQAYKADVIEAGITAQELMEKGDIDGALKALEAGYNKVIDGHSIQFEGNQYTLLDGNKVVAQGQITPELIQQQIRAARTGQLFDDALMRRAQPPTGDTAPHDPAPPPAGGTATGQGGPASGQEGAIPEEAPSEAGAPASEGNTQLAGAIPEGDTAPTSEGNNVTVRPRRPQYTAPADYESVEPRPVAPTEGLTAKRLAMWNKMYLDPWTARRAEWQANQRQMAGKAYDADRMDITEENKARNQDKVNSRQSARDDRRAKENADRTDRTEAFKVGEQRRQHTEKLDEANPEFQRDYQMGKVNKLADKGKEMLLRTDEGQHEGAAINEMIPRERAQVGYRNAEKVNPADKEDWTSREEELNAALDKGLSIAPMGTNGKNVDTSKVIKVDEGVRRQLIDIGGQVLEKTKGNPATIMRTIYALTHPDSDEAGSVQIDPRTGQVLVGGPNGMRLIMSADTLRQVATMRGQGLGRAKKADADTETKRVQGVRDQEERARLAAEKRAREDADPDEGAIRTSRDRSLARNFK